MAKISLYPHHNYWWAPVRVCYPCLLLTFFFFVFASIIQCFENMQLTTKSFLNFTSASLRCANVKERVLLEVAFLVLAYAPYFQRRCFPQAQRVAGRRGKEPSSRGAGDTFLQGNDADEQTLFWCLFMQSDTLILLKTQPQLLTNLNVFTSKTVLLSTFN